ncbi:MAG TPA: DnaJ domain-containing protein, partial [Solidesulfovibrio sp.]|nr:DnaJ domain-containing protein [Solidesulfovibrio sp.]
MPDDPYALLGVAPDADAEALRRAYRARALACHPDVHPDDPRAVERFLALGQAYAMLADPLRRAAYDLERGVPAPVVRFEAAQDGAPPSPFVDDAFFVAAPRLPRRGADVRWTLDIPAHVAECGGRLHIGAAPAMACPVCAGT